MTSISKVYQQSTLKTVREVKPEDRIWHDGGLTAPVKKVTFNEENNRGCIHLVDGNSELCDFDVLIRVVGPDFIDNIVLQPLPEELTIFADIVNDLNNSTTKRIPLIGRRLDGTVLILVSDSSVMVTVEDYAGKETVWERFMPYEEVEKLIETIDYNSYHNPIKMGKLGFVRV